MYISTLRRRNLKKVFSLFLLFLTEIGVCSFNNELGKCAYDKAFYILATAQFFEASVRDCVDFLAIGGSVTTSQDGISYMYMYNAFRKSSYLGHC